jgi:tetratricopeptide (TPR) repeat protein
MMQKRICLLLFLVFIVFIGGCVASHLNEAKNQYLIALRSADPLPHYKAALEELDAAIARDENLLQAYAIKGLIYRNLEDFERATENLEIAKQGSYAGQLQWVPIVINLTYGEIFHHQAGAAIRAGDWEGAKSYQETALQFFNNVLNSSFSSLGEVTQSDEELGVAMQDLYVKAQQRWAAGKFQMATIVGRTESKERQNELLGEVTTRLSAVIESYPESTSLRYYLAEGYYKQGLTIQTTDLEESKRLQEKAMSQLRVCAELGLPGDLRNTAAQLVRMISKGTKTETEMKILGTSPSQ